MTVGVVYETPQTALARWRPRLDTSTMDLTSVFTLARNDTDEVDLWQKNYGEMNEASFSKLTSDKYSQVHLLALWSAKAREKGDVLRGQKKNFT